MARVLVVGGGITGLASAWALGRDGHQVTLLEQARLPNPKGSSVDEHCYNTHSSAGRNRHASPWQETLCLAIASADGGVIEDPQFGIFRRVDATAEVPDPQRVPLWRIVKAHSRLFMGFTRAFLRI